jgi:hypothetical protein
MGRHIAAVILAAACSTTCRSQPVEYDAFQIQCATGDILFNLPAGSSLSSATPVINDDRQAGVKVVYPGASGVFLGRDASGSIVFSAASPAFVSDPAINGPGALLWEMADVATPGLYLYDPDSGQSDFYTNRPLGATAWSSVTLDDLGRAGYRATLGFGDHAHVSFDPDSGDAIHAVEVGLDPNSPYSYLYSPAMNSSRQIASKVSLTTFDEHEIRIFETNGSSVLIAQNDDVDPSSPYASFRNSVDINDARQVAFIADLAAGGAGVYVSDGQTTTTVATTDAADISSIEFFHPVMSEAGLVAFRAFDSTGRRAIFIGDGAGLVKVAAEGTEIPGPAGQPLYIGRFIDDSPAFGGSPGINAAGDVVFNAQLNDGTDLLGAAIVVAMVADGCVADFNGDGATNTLDVLAFLNAWNAGDDSADMNEDGFIDTRDVLAFLNLWTAGC